jgi:hypothetical protein
LSLGQEVRRGDGQSHRFQQGIRDVNFQINAFHYALEARGMPLSRAPRGSRRPATWPGAKKQKSHTIKTKPRMVVSEPVLTNPRKSLKT